LLAGDNAGFPNVRRVSDDVTDSFFRFMAGVLVSGFNVSPNDLLGDGGNTNDIPFQEAFHYGRLGAQRAGSRHIDPGEPTAHCHKIR
jgi:hypothetical protein